MRSLLASLTVVLIAFFSAPSYEAAEQLGAKPETLTTPYQTEHEWALRETVADISEMASASRGTKSVPPQPPANVTPWQTEALAPLALQLLTPPPKDSPEPALADQYVALADLTAANLVRSSDVVSTALARNLRSPRAHESAALVLVGFGLREAADVFNDVRWTLNRMTAHLAIAQALRAGTPPSLDGQLAGVGLLVLSGRSASALTALAGIVDRPTDQPLGAWKRALRLRLTSDWRITPAAAKAYRIEKLEYFRARTITLRSRRAGQELAELAEPVSPDFTRIVQISAWGVEDGHQFVVPAIAGELRELAQLHTLIRRAELPKELPAAIVNVRAGRLMSEGQPRVIPWGAWAEFFQRHAGMNLGELDDHYRRMLGTPERADQIKAQLDQSLGHLTMFPVASTRWNRGRGTEADLRHIVKAIDLAYRAPELIPYERWTYLDVAARYEVVKRGLPVPTTWFALPSAATPYEAGLRAADRLGWISMPALEALVAEASSDLLLASRALAPRPLNQALVKNIVAWIKARGDYDEYAINAAVRWSRTIEEQIAWRRQGCGLSVGQCLELAWLLEWSGDEKGAVAEFERAFRDPAIDLVTLANASSWLVGYYERSGQLQRAYDLAERAAAVGSSPGLVTLARLYERRNRADEAGLLFERNAGRYDRSDDELVAFFYRQAVVAARPGYLERWRAAERQMFPSGMQKLPAKMPAQPAKGVFVNQDSALSRFVRLQAGDIIVGVDGWLVEDKEQYDTLMALPNPEGKHKITAWRGVLFTVELPRNHGMDLQAHPLKGWIQ